MSWKPISYVENSMTAVVMFYANFKFRIVIHSYRFVDAANFELFELFELGEGLSVTYSSYGEKHGNRRILVKYV